jgi:outer membrane receptor protein involved in Fe transport
VKWGAAKGKERQRLLYGRPLLFAVVVAWPGVASGQAVAPSGAASPTPDQVIIVTGSRIPRHNLTATSPVTVVGSQEAKLEGTTNIEDLLNSLPQVQPGFTEFSNNGATGTATVDLRSLSPGRTLVLVNGRRMVPGDPNLPVPDVNMIPSTLIGRIEILTGGASSVYGSDAIAGVVNFILDTHLDGIRVDAQASVFQHDNNTQDVLRKALADAEFAFPSGNTVDGGRQDFNVAVGKSLFDGKLHVSVYGGYRHISGLTQDARDYSACSAQVRPSANTALFCGGSDASFPGNFYNLVEDQEYFLGPDRTFLPGRIQFNFAPYNYFQRPDRRYIAGAFADLELSEAIKPYLEVMYLDDRSVVQIAPSGDFNNTETINCDNPLLSAQQLGHVCFDGNFVGQEDGGDPIAFTDPVSGHSYFQAFLFPERRLVEGGARTQDIRHKNLRLVGGLKGDLARGVSYDASYVRSRVTKTLDASGFLSSRKMRNALDVVTDPATGEPACRTKLTGEDRSCVPWDIFIIGGVTQAAVDYLTVTAHQHGSVDEQVANFNSTLNLGEWGIRSPWATDGISLNVGAEYRKDKLAYAPDPLQFTGDLAGGGNPELPVHGSTQVKELFAEARIPLVDHDFLYGLALEGGYRQSWHANSEHKNSADAYKVGLQAEPVRGLRLRGSLQRAVRAPNIVELFSPVINDNSLADDPCAGTAPEATLAQCQLTGVTTAQYGHIAKLGGGDFLGYNSTSGGNTELAPETATTKTLGLVLEPGFAPGLTASVDWWDIRVKGAIEPLLADEIMANCIGTGDSVFCGRIHRDAHGSLWLTPQGYVDARNLNIGELHPSGLDVGFDYDRPFGRLGRVNFNFLGTYTYRWRVDEGGLSEPFDCAGLFGNGCGTPTPSWRHKARLTWTTRNMISLSLNWRYYAREKLAPSGLVPGPYSRAIAAQSYFDLSAVAAVANNYSFRIGVNNLFDHEPPLLPSCTGGCNGNTYPQFFDPLGRYIFAGVTVKFSPF